MIGRYASPTKDSTFKLIFGQDQHKQLTIDFLNDFLGRTKEYGNLIVDISFMHQEQTPRRLGEKKSIIDIHCQDQREHRFIIEMQAGIEHYFEFRALFYAASLLSRQLQETDPYSELKPVIIIGIVGFNFFKKRKDPISHHLICDMATGEQSINLIELHFIELPKFLKLKDQLETQIDKWLFFLKEAHRQEDIPQACQDSPSIKEAFSLMERTKWTKTQSERYELEIREYRKEITQELAEQVEREKKLQEGLEQGLEQGLQQGLQQGLEQGLEQGLQQGLQQGAQKEKESFAIKLLKKGLQISEVVELTDLSIEQIKELVEYIRE